MSGQETVSGNVTTYDVDNPYIVIENIEMFSFSALSFKDANEEDTNTGKITVYYELNPSAFVVDGSKYKAKLALQLSYQDLAPQAPTTRATVNLFQEFKDSGGSIDVKYKCNDVTTNITPTINSQGFIEFEHSIELSGAPPGPIKFSITYEFTIGDGGNFHNAFGKYIAVGNNSTPTKFIARAQLTNST